MNKLYLPTQIAVELSSGSNGHFAIPLPIPGNGSFDMVRFDCGRDSGIDKKNNKNLIEN